jgi:hypothetical protein
MSNEATAHPSPTPSKARLNIEVVASSHPIDAVQCFALKGKECNKGRSSEIVDGSRRVRRQVVNGRHKTSCIRTGVKLLTSRTCGQVGAKKLKQPLRPILW